MPPPLNVSGTCQHCAMNNARWAVVDVETTGTSPATCRVISIAALAITDAGVITDRVVSLLNANTDPGPTHIHGLTREMLSDKPQFADIAADLSGLLRGRTLVAHNVAFDHSFLAAEARRAHTELPVEAVMCTVELARRLDLGVDSLKLGTLAQHFGITQHRPHDALDDAQVLAQIFTHVLKAARANRIALPLRSPDSLQTPIFRASA